MSSVYHHSGYILPNLQPVPWWTGLEHYIVPNYWRITSIILKIDYLQNKFGPQMNQPKTAALHANFKHMWDEIFDIRVHL